MNEARYSRLTREFPEHAEKLFKENDRPQWLATITLSAFGATPQHNSDSLEE